MKDSKKQSIDSTNKKKSIDSNNKMIVIEKDKIKSNKQLPLITKAAGSQNSSANTSDNTKSNNIVINKENLQAIQNLKLSTSPENKTSTDKNKNFIQTPSLVKPGTAININTKQMNVIPLKTLNSNRENNQNINTNTNFFTNTERIPSDRFSPKPRDIKITTHNMSPKQKNIPMSTKNTTIESNKIPFEPKYSNKIFNNINNNLMHKSPSPKHNEPQKLTKKSPDATKK